MFKFLALVAFVALASAASLPKDLPLSPSGRIVGGEATTIAEVPYQVSFRSFGKAVCGGSIISKYYVLTAAHCVGILTFPYTILAGSTDRTSGGSKHHVASIIRHEEYNVTAYKSPINDVALIRVVEPFEFDETRQPIALFNEDEETPVGEFAVISGWGSTDGFAPTYPTVLQTVSVPIVSKKECSKAYVSFGGISDGQICAGFPEGGKDACKADSGGPLAVNGRLAGIVSWGNGCALAGQPTVYTEVAAYRAWIKAKSGV